MSDFLRRRTAPTIIILLLSVSYQAAALEVVTPMMINTTSGQNATMAAPRWKGYMDPEQPERFWVMHSGWSSSATIGRAATRTRFAAAATASTPRSTWWEAVSRSPTKAAA